MASQALSAHSLYLWKLEADEVQEQSWKMWIWKEVFSFHLSHRLSWWHITKNYYLPSSILGVKLYLKNQTNPNPTKQKPQTNKNQSKTQTTQHRNLSISQQRSETEEPLRNEHLHSRTGVRLKLEAQCPDFQTHLEGVLGSTEVTALSHLNLSCLRASSLPLGAAERCLLFLFFSPQQFILFSTQFIFYLYLPQVLNSWWK